MTYGEDTIRFAWLPWRKQKWP